MLLLTLAVLDARYLWLPDALTLPLAALGLTLGDWVLPGSFADRVIGAVAGAGAAVVLALGYRRLRGRDGLGGWAMPSCSARLAPGSAGQALPFVLLIASATALLWVLALRLRGQAIEAQMRVPLGTFLCMAVVPGWMIALSLGI